MNRNSWVVWRTDYGFLGWRGRGSINLSLNHQSNGRSLRGLEPDHAVLHLAGTG